MTGSTRRWLALAAAVVVAGGLVTGIALTHSSTSGVPVPVGEQPATIGSSGVELSAYTYTPGGTGRHALVVMPVPFGSPGTIYRPIAAALQARGYEVVTYVQRGFHESGGDVDFAGPATQADASAVISWALGHTAADSQRIGMAGLSYGGVVSLLAAARDDRIRAVVAVSTWTDFARTFAANATPSKAAAATLVSEARSRLAPSVAAWADATNDPNTFTTQTATLSAVRSPQHYLAQLNRNDPAIMIANAYEDSFIPPAQLIDFFSGLTTPKRLELTVGDHTAPAYTAVHGGDNATMDGGYAWLDHYLLGRSAALAAQSPIVLQDATTKAEHGYQVWPAHDTAVAIGSPNQPADVGTAAAWSATLPSDTDSGANSGAFQDAPGAAYRGSVLQFAAVPPGSALVWSSTRSTRDRLLSGTPRLHIGIAGSANTATVFAYLYEVAPSGLGALMSVQPYTATGLTPGTSRSVTIDLEPISWTVRAGNRLALVVDTADPRFSSPTPTGAGVTLSSTLADPAALSLPIG